MLSSATLSAEIGRFMIPAAEGDPPELGWPDEGNTSSVAAQDTSPADSGGTTSLLTAGADASPYLYGRLIAAPYWVGAEITAVSGGQVTVADDALHPGGPIEASVFAAADDQAVYALPGAPVVAGVQEIRRVSDDRLFAVDTGHPSHNPAAGVIAVGVGSGVIMSGDELKFTYTLVFLGPVPAGTAYTLVPPRGAPGNPFTGGKAWADAYTTYVAQGAANGIAPASLDAPREAMRAVLDAMLPIPIPPGLGPFAFQAGVLAFWGAVAALSSSIFPTSVVTTPPPAVAGLAAIMTGLGLAALPFGPTDPWSQAPYQAVADLYGAGIHGASQGAQVVFVVGGTPTPFPLL